MSRLENNYKNQNVRKCSAYLCPVISSPPSGEPPLRQPPLLAPVTSLVVAQPPSVVESSGTPGSSSSSVDGSSTPSRSSEDAQGSLAGQTKNCVTVYASVPLSLSDGKVKN